jgi:hypothetical protein
MSDRIELHEFLKLVAHYYPYPHLSPWTKTYDEMVEEILEYSKCTTLLEAIAKAKIDRAVPGVQVTIADLKRRHVG